MITSTHPASPLARRDGRKPSQLPARRSARHQQAGQGLLEFALVFPILLVLVMGAIDFGFAFRAQIMLTNAAREGARLGVTGVSTEQVAAKTVDAAGGLLSSEDVTVENAASDSGQPMTVTVDYEYEYVTPIGSLVGSLFGDALADPLPLTASVTMRLE